MNFIYILLIGQKFLTFPCDFEVVTAPYHQTLVLHGNISGYQGRVTWLFQIFIMIS